jgi:hypothetical protein
MEGCRRRERRQGQQAVAIGWHAANFARAGKNLKDLNVYLKRFDEKPDIDPAEEAAAIFADFEARGWVKIKVVARKDA